MDHRSDKTIKKLIKNNLKVTIAFILGGIIFSTATYAATYSFASGDVAHTKTDGTGITYYHGTCPVCGKENVGDSPFDKMPTHKAKKTVYTVEESLLQAYE